MNVFEISGIPAVWVWPKAFSDQDVRELILLEDWPRGDCLGYRVNRPYLAPYLGMKFHQRMPEFDCTGWSPTVTFSSSKNPIPWHCDAPCGAAFKVFVYLNAPPWGGGTIIGGVEHKDIVVRAETGTIVMFDISLEHRSEDLPKGFLKKTLGMRPFGVTLNGSAPRGLPPES